MIRNYLACRLSRLVRETSPYAVLSSQCNKCVKPERDDESGSSLHCPNDFIGVSVTTRKELQNLERSLVRDYGVITFPRTGQFRSRESISYP